MAQKKKSFFGSLFNFEMPASRKKLIKKFKDASKKKSSQSLDSAKKSVDKKIADNRKKTFGTKKTGIPETTQSKKRLKNLIPGMSKLQGSTPVKAPGGGPKKKPNIAKLKYGMGQVDSLSKAKVKQGPPKPSSSTKTKKKSSFLGDIKKAISETKRNFGPGRMKSANERNLDSKGNYKGTNIKPTALQLSRMKKPKKNTMANTTGSELMQKKKDDGKAPMYESKGTKVKKAMGGSKMKKSKYMAKGGKTMTPKAKPKTYTGKKTSYTVDKSGIVQFKSMGGKMKKSKYYAGGGMVFTGR